MDVVFNDVHRLQRLAWALLTTVIGVGLAFAGYYYWDRYVHIGDKSPLELGISELEAQVRENPSDPELRLALAEHYLRSSRFEDALQQASQVRSALPDNEQAMLMVGLAHTFLGDLEMAVPELEQFTALRRQAPTASADMALEAALYYLGENYLKLERPADALPVIRDALVINPTDADAHYLLGIAYLRTDQHQFALESFQEAIRYVPSLAVAPPAIAGIPRWALHSVSPGQKRGFVSLATRRAAAPPMFNPHSPVTPIQPRATSSMISPCRMASTRLSRIYRRLSAEPIAISSAKTVTSRTTPHAVLPTRR